MAGVWRERSRKVIEAVIKEVDRDDMPRLRKAISEAYPFGPRENWPYKAWCAEVRFQLGIKNQQQGDVTEHDCPLFGEV